ncbi:MAG: phosphoenolpyruvate--protein phosphotransferase [Kiritimatiellae bacterium]|nr:phosphoenolpyruvate--protein phosphotransferase [Kiritimatiellia bacterium]
MKVKYQPDTLLKGLPLSGGVAVARVCLFNDRRHADLPMVRVSGDEVERERTRLIESAAIARDRLEEIRRDVAARIGPAEAEIFAAQRLILEDEVLINEMLAIVEGDTTNAEAAVHRVLDRYETRFLEMDDEYIKERASDMGEIRRRLLDILRQMQPSFQCAGEEHCQRGRNRIVVAEELTPSLTVDLDARHTLGFVTERGGANSHAAILARALGIPAVSGITGIHSAISCGTELLVDGNKGEVVVWPSEATLARARTEHGEKLAFPAAVPAVRGLAVMANISVAADVQEAVRMQAEGIGLYRTEFEFFTAGEPLDEDAQYERYASVIKAMAGKPVCFRLLDGGGDKPFGFLEVPQEENPALGWRGSRLLLDNPDLLRTQARAIARASRHGPVRVMYPVVVSLEQFRRLKDLFNAAIQGVDHGEIMQGVMFEVPAACLQAREILAEADFASIGTNDLVQYLFAVDRNNERVAADYNPDQPVLWSLLKDLAAIARELGRPLSVCGEMAGDPKYVLKLVDAGITAVSVSPRLIPGVRHAVLARNGARV